MGFMCDDNERLLKKYKEIWEKIGSMLGKEFAAKPTHKSEIHEYINTKIREREDEIVTNFH